MTGSPLAGAAWEGRQRRARRVRRVGAALGLGAAGSGSRGPCALTRPEEDAVSAATSDTPCSCCWPSVLAAGAAARNGHAWVDLMHKHSVTGRAAASEGQASMPVCRQAIGCSSARSRLSASGWAGPTPCSAERQGALTVAQQPPVRSPFGCIRTSVYADHQPEQRQQQEAPNAADSISRHRHDGASIEPRAETCKLVTFVCGLEGPRLLSRSRRWCWLTPVTKHTSGLLPYLLASQLRPPGQE